MPVNQLRESEMYHEIYVLFNLRDEFVLAPNPVRHWKPNRISNAAVNLFTFNKFKSILKHTQVLFFTLVFEREFAFLLSANEVDVFVLSLKIEG